MRYIILFFFVGVIGISSVAAGQEDGGQSNPAAAAPSEQATGDLYAGGRALAAKYCSICHLEPAPAILPKRSWEPLLGYMGYHLGITDISYLASHPPYVMPNVESKYRILKRDFALPDSPALKPDEWAALRRYYLANAPATPLPQLGKPPLNWNLPQFDIVESDYSVRVAVTTMVHIREATREVYIGDAMNRTLAVLDHNGQTKSPPMRLVPEISPVDIEFEGTTAYIASIGDLTGLKPLLAKPGLISSVRLANHRIVPETSKVVLKDLFRLAGMVVADLNQDRRLDFVVCEFGGVFGRFSWFEAEVNGEFLQHVLMSLPGAVAVEAHDLDRDGRDDLLVLVADAREGLHLFVNEGGRGFAHQPLFETGPSYGHTRFQLQDFNGDGLTDVLVANGDNIDSDPYNTPKNYHGIRIYLNRGDFKFEEAYFYPMYGAFDARAADFDGDGDLDIAAIAFYPDYEAESWESFAYLENRGGFDFVPYTNETVMGGRWLTMDVGDIDGDQDPDVVLGGAYIPVGMLAHMAVFQRLLRSGPQVLVLKNNRSRRE